MKDSISIIIPAYNEEHSLLDAVNIAERVVSRVVGDYEIIIVNDGSTDGTGRIADRIRGKNRHVRVIHHRSNQGFGSTFKDGIRAASKTYCTGFPADNDLYEDTFRDIVSARKKDCIVMTYMSDTSLRNRPRRIISTIYTIIVNFLFRLKLQYYNGYFICPTTVLQRLDLKSEGFTLFAEIKIKLIKKYEFNYREIPYVCGPRLWGTSKALTPKSILQTVTMIPILLSDIYVRMGRKSLMRNNKKTL